MPDSCAVSDVSYVSYCLPAGPSQSGRSVVLAESFVLRHREAERNGLAGRAKIVRSFVNRISLHWEGTGLPTCPGQVSTAQVAFLALGKRTPVQEQAFFAPALCSDLLPSTPLSESGPSNGALGKLHHSVAAERRFQLSSAPPNHANTSLFAAIDSTFSLCRLSWMCVISSCSTSKTPYQVRIQTELTRLGLPHILVAT